MTNEEQVTICKTIAAACMWGQGGIARVILDDLELTMPMDRRWNAVYSAHAEQAQRERMGVITDEAELLRYLRDGYWLVNGDSLFNPPPMNGLCKYVSKELYDKHNRSPWR